MLKQDYISLNYNRCDNYNFKIKTSDFINKPDFNKELYDELITYKNKISNISLNIWDFTKKKTYDFELIEKKNYLFDYVPISRSYYKLWEILKDFNLIDYNNKLNIVGLAEGPGGFIECIYNYRKKYFSKFNDNYLCMSLYSSDTSIPSWNSFKQIFNKNINNQFEIFYGNDKTGNLYNPENLFSLQNKCKNIDLVTCDGGFNYSIDYNNQEQLSYKLIYCQILGAIFILKINGHFVLKIFDIYTKFTLKIIYFLTTLFENVIITKPHTSRPANSEKYIVCKNFKGISNNIKNNLIEILKNWNKLEEEKKYITDIFNFNIPKDFEETISKYIKKNTNLQINNINTTLDIIENKNNNNDKAIKENQIKYADIWCKYYDIEKKK